MKKRKKNTKEDYREPLRMSGLYGSVQGLSSSEKDTREKRPGLKKTAARHASKELAPSKLQSTLEFSGGCKQFGLMPRFPTDQHGQTGFFWAEWHIDTDLRRRFL
jgi:hypothetical protein